MIFFDFDPRNSKFRFFEKKEIVKNTNFCGYKNEYLFSSCIQQTRIQNFKATSLFSAVQLYKMQVTEMTSLFEAQFFGIPYCRTQNKWHFWNTEVKLDKIGMFL